MNSETHLTSVTWNKSYCDHLTERHPRSLICICGTVWYELWETNPSRPSLTAWFGYYRTKKSASTHWSTGLLYSPRWLIVAYSPLHLCRRNIHVAYFYDMLNRNLVFVQQNLSKNKHVWGFSEYPNVTDYISKLKGVGLDQRTCTKSKSATDACIF
jgi:hypothetical protein